MKIEEAHKYVVKDNRMTLENPGYFLVDEKDESNYLKLFTDITNLMENKKESVRSIRNNPMVYDIKKEGILYSIDTKIGKGYFYKASEILGEEVSNQCFFDNQCHSNSIVASILINSVSKESNPSVYTGITTFSLGRPVLHSVCSVDTRRGKLIIDYTYNVAMSEELFLKLYNFKILTNTKIDNLEKLMFLEEEYAEYTLKKTGKKIVPDCAGVYFLLANEDCLKYMRDIIDEKREDNFPFVTNKDFEKKMEKLKNNKR